MVTEKITINQMSMFPYVFRISFVGFVGIFAALSAGLPKDSDQISMKLSRRMEHRPRKNPKHSKADPNQGEDALIIFNFC